VGDFLYTPDFDEDIAEYTKYVVGDAVAVAPKVSFQKYRSVTYRMRQILDEAGKVTGFEMFEEGDATFGKLLGTAGVIGGKPAPPVKLL
jgi:hypothetical protein